MSRYSTKKIHSKSLRMKKGRPEWYEILENNPYN